MNIARKLKDGGVGIIQTDTLYGLVASAMSRKAVKRIYKLKGNRKKPFIILIKSPEDLKLFRIRLNAAEKRILRFLWPGRVTVILPYNSKKFSYLRRGWRSLAFRVPDSKPLRKLLKTAGPLVAPSANPSGLTPAKNTKEARKYFGDAVDFYPVRKPALSNGVYSGSAEPNPLPSTLIRIKENKAGTHISIERNGQGDDNIKKLCRRYPKIKISISRKAPGSSSLSL